MALCILVGLLFYFYSYYFLSCCFNYQTATYLRAAPDEYVRGWGVLVIEDLIGLFFIITPWAAWMMTSYYYRKET
jgi:hypothetical protein